MADYIPGPDAGFQAWQSNFVTYANANLAALGLTAPDMAPITAAQTGWATAFPAHVAAVNAAKAAKQTKAEARAAYVAVIRPLVRRLQASAVVSDAEKASLGITVAQSPAPIGPPVTAPICSIECGARLQHTLRFVDKQTPTRPPTKAKPAGVLGVEIWNHVGNAPPTGEGDLRFVAVDTSAPFVLNYNSADGGKTAYYWMRWVSPTGERGPWDAHRGVRVRSTTTEVEPSTAPARAGAFDLFWIKDESRASLPDADVLAAEIVEDLQDALEQFTGIAASLVGMHGKQAGVVRR